MQRHTTLRLAGVSLSAAALGLLTAEGTAAAHDGSASTDLHGRVASVGSGDVVLKRFDGTSETITTTSATSYSEPGSSVAPTGVLDGGNVAVTLDPTASSPTASNVTVVPERVGGRVTNVAGSTITVTRQRATETVMVSQDTNYVEQGAHPTGVTDGELITAFGLPDPSTPGDVDAQVIAIFNPSTQPQPQPVARPGRGPATTAWGRPSPGTAPAFSHAPSGGRGGRGFGGGR